MAPKRSSRYQTSALPVTIFAHLVALAVIGLLLYWLIHFGQGFAFKYDNNFDQTRIRKIFNVHPLFMVVGFILIMGEAIMAYKIVPGSRTTQKLVHLILHFIALLASIVGLTAVFRSHHIRGVPDIYSLHSWLGISTVSLFAVQWVFSFFTFWYPRAEQQTRARLAPWHAVIGIVIFSMAILSAMTGLGKFAINGYHTKEELVINFTGLLILLFAISVGVTVSLPRY